jgi:hypothetical protein
MILMIIILALLMILCWILFAPLIMRVDTETENYSVSLPGIFKARVIQDETEVYFRIHILFIPLNIRPSRFAGGEPRMQQKREISITSNLKYRMMAFRDLVRSFRIKQLYVNVDTEDWVLNANLAPILMLTNTDRISLHVNFMEENSLIIDIRNRLANFLWTGIKYKYRTIVKP